MGKERSLEVAIAVFTPYERLDPLCLGIQDLQREG